MSGGVAIVYHSRDGHTAVLAEALAQGAAEEGGSDPLMVGLPATELPWDALDAAGAIVFGSPTYFGSASAEMKQFMDATDPVWSRMAWRNKLAAGFTCAGDPSGDKLNVLVQMAVFAGQHGMVWIGLDPLMDVRTGAGKPAGYNRLGGYLGPIAQAGKGAPTPDSPPEEDRRTLELYGRRIARALRCWNPAGMAAA